MTTPEASQRQPFGGPRLVVATALTAGLGVAVAAVFLHSYPRANDVGPTAAALGDAFAWIFGASLGLSIGALVFVTAGSAVGVALRRVLRRRSA